MEFTYLVEEGQILVSEEELDRLCEETGLYEDEVLSLISEATKEERKAQVAQQLAAAIADLKKQIQELRKSGNPADLERADAMERVVNWFENPANVEKFQRGVKIGSIGAISLTALALAAGGVALVKKIKKGKAKKAAAKQAQAEAEDVKSEDVTINYFITDDGILIAEGMDFILESLDYEVSEEDIYQVILDEAEEAEQASEGQPKEKKAKLDMGKIKELGGKAKDLVYKDGKLTTGGAVGAGALGAAAIIGGGAAIAKGLKSRKAKKQAAALQPQSEDVMIEFFIEGQNIYIEESDVDFLIECSDYTLSEQDIADVIVELSEEEEKTEEPAAKKKFDLKKVKNLVIDPETGKMTTGSKVAAGAAAVIGGGLAVNKILKNRKAKKAAAKQAQAEAEDVKSEDVMINYVIAENAIYVTEDSLDLLLEETDFELTEEELVQAICEAAEVKLEIPGDGVKVVTSEKELAKVKEKQEVDLKSQLEESTEELDEVIAEVQESLDLIHKDLDDANDLLYEAIEMLDEGLADMSKGAKIGTTAAVGLGAVGAGYGLYKGLTSKKAAEGRVRRAERKLKRAKMNREEMDRIEKEDEHRKAVELATAHNAKNVNIGGKPATPRVSPYNNPLSRPIAKKVAKGIAKDKYKADVKIEKAQRKLDKAKSKLEKYEEPKLEAVELVIPGDGVKPITSEKELVKVPEKQEVDIAKGPEEDKPNEGVRTNGGEIRVQESAEYDEFAETWEGDHIIMEAVLGDMDIELSESEMYDMIDRHLLSERSIVKLDKQAKMTHAQKKALMVIAREQNDPIYKKLDKIYKQRRVLLNQLEEKYGSRAMSRVRSAKSKVKQMRDED